MTRINVIPPRFLADQHLIGEIKEINQLAGSFRRSLNSKNGINIDDIPEDFTLNTGHVKFFYDKGLYLKQRFDWCKREAEHRNFNIEAEFNNEWLRGGRHDLYNDWIPRPEDRELIKERLREKINMKPEYYRLYGGEYDITLLD